MILRRTDGITIGEGATLREIVEKCRNNLRKADLRNADLIGANLSKADLRNANLIGANLRYAILSNANLSGANLIGANLRNADLRNANLSYADLRNADLSTADLRNADLSYADLSYADLSNADLSNADLRYANLSNDADLRNAILSNAILPTGERWEEYLSETVPAFLTAGGKSLAEVLATGCWECHEWSNCPTHAAFGANIIDDVPILLRPRAEQFIQFFDAGLIPEPSVPQTVGG
jgi:hypothetical protein